MADVAFGTYQHATPQESRALRKYADEAFSRLLRPLYAAHAPLRILDAGCGLGLLTSVVAKLFPNAAITGADLFRHHEILTASRRYETSGGGDEPAVNFHDLS